MVRLFVLITAVAVIVMVALFTIDGVTGLFSETGGV